MTHCGAAAWKTPYRDAQLPAVRPFIEDVVNSSSHPTDEAIAALLDGALPASERDAVSRHLATCDECRALLGPPQAPEIADPKAFPVPATPLRHVPRDSHRVIGVVAAAVMVVAVALQVRRPSTGADVTRDGATSTVEGRALTARSPSSGASLVTDTLVLRWAPAGASATYDVSIVDAAGELVWRANVDTVDIAPPADVKARLRPGRRYHWQVDAQLPDLRTTTTGPQEFIPISP